MSNAYNCRTKLAELTLILKDEAAILRSGKFHDLEAITSRKAKHLSELEASMSELQNSDTLKAIIPQVEKVNRSANENLVLLKAVMNGFRAAQDQIKYLENKKAQVGAYARNGQKLLITDYTYRTKLV